MYRALTLHVESLALLFYVLLHSIIFLVTEMDITEGEEKEAVATDRQFECVICGQISSSTFDRPFGEAVLIHPTRGEYILL